LFLVARARCPLLSPRLCLALLPPPCCVASPFALAVPGEPIGLLSRQPLPRQPLRACLCSALAIPPRACWLAQLLQALASFPSLEVSQISPLLLAWRSARGAPPKDALLLCSSWLRLARMARWCALASLPPSAPRFLRSAAASQALRLPFPGVLAFGSLPPLLLVLAGAGSPQPFSPRSFSSPIRPRWKAA